MEVESSRKTTLLSAWHVILLTIVIPLLVYTLSYSGSFRADDEHILAARAQSLALWGELDQPQVYGNSRVRDLSAMGDQATQVEPVQSVLGAGLHWMGTRLGTGGIQTLFLLNLYLTALTAGVVAMTILLLGHPGRVALWSGTLFGLSTMVWPYATTFFRDTLAMFFTALALLGWTLARRRSGWWRVVGIGTVILSLILGVLTKNSILAIGIGFLVAWTLPGARTLWGGPAMRRRLLFGAGLLVLGIMLVTLLPGEGPLARFSLPYYRFLLEHFSQSVKPGLIGWLAGPFLSPAKSIFLFSPALVLVLIWPRNTSKRDRRLALLVFLGTAFLVLAQALFYRDAWAGTFGWGLRFTLPAIPLWMVLAASSIEKMLDRRRGRVFIWGLLIAGALVQVSGAWVSWSAFYRDRIAGGLDPFSAKGVWDPRLFAPASHLARLADPDNWDLAWARLLRSGHPAAILVPATVVVLTAAAIWLAWRLINRHGPKRGLGSTFGGVCLLAFALPWFLVAGIYQADPALARDRGEFMALMERVGEEIQPEEVVVVDSYGTPLWTFWMNEWDRPQRWHSLPFEIPDTNPSEVPGNPSQASLQLFQALEGQAERLIYVTSDDAPDYALGREVRWLGERYRLLDVVVFRGDGVAEMYVYDLGATSD